MRRALLSLVMLSTVACGSHVEESYNAFVDRSAAWRGGDATSQIVEGELQELDGDYLWNIYLRPLGVIYLRLRATFDQWELTEDGQSAFVHGELRLADADPEGPALADFTSTMDESGHMLVRLGHCDDPTDVACPVYVPGHLSPMEGTAVRTLFYLDITALPDGSLCGGIAVADLDGNDIADRSVVVEPMPLSLVGATFGGTAYLEGGAEPVDVADRCPGQSDPVEDTGADDGDVGVDIDEEPPLAPPEFSYEGTERADVTGRFYMDVRAAGAMNVDFVADLTYREDADGLAAVDGALRSLNFSPAAPALAFFSAEVDETGHFGVVIEDLETETAAGTLIADIALTGAIVDGDTICGVGAGETFEPLAISLDGTTFGAVRIPDDAFEAPEVSMDACP